MDEGLIRLVFFLLYISLAFAMIIIGWKYNEHAFCSFHAPLYLQINGWLLVLPGIACIFGIPYFYYVVCVRWHRLVEESKGFLEFLVAFFLGWLIEAPKIGRIIGDGLKMYEEIITAVPLQHEFLHKFLQMLSLFIISRNGPCVIYLMLLYQLSTTLLSTFFQYLFHFSKTTILVVITK